MVTNRATTRIAAAQNMLHAGDVTRVLGSYRLLHELGSGGMGSVWQAEHVKLGRRAAVKVLHATISSSPEMVNRFFNEARAATAISDPGIVQIYDFGEAEDGTGYIVMEMLDGETLDRRLHRINTFGLAEALRLVRQVASSLGAAHARGIIHRDLKPENIFIVHDAEVVGGERTKILDFGIAKLATTSSVKTQTAALMGTPMFMSPEQCRGAGTVDHRSDIYSLGCVLFALIAGRPPFVAEGAGEVIAMHLREQAPLLSSLVTDLPASIDHLVARCLDKDVNRRPATCAALAAELGAVLQQLEAGAAARPMVVTSPYTTAPPTTLSSASSQIEPPRERSRRWLTGLVALGGAAAISFVVVGRRGGTSEPAPVVVAHPAVAIDAALDGPVDAAIATDAAPDAAPVVTAPRPAPKRPKPVPTPASSLELGSDGLPSRR